MLLVLSELWGARIKGDFLRCVETEAVHCILSPRTLIHYYPCLVRENCTREMIILYIKSVKASLFISQGIQGIK